MWGQAAEASIGLSHTEFLEKFAGLIRAEFLEKSGQYVTNDASREAVINEAVAAEREACAKVCEQAGAAMAWGVAASIRARGGK